MCIEVCRFGFGFSFYESRKFFSSNIHVPAENRSYSNCKLFFVWFFCLFFVILYCYKDCRQKLKMRQNLLKILYNVYACKRSQQLNLCFRYLKVVASGLWVMYYRPKAFSKRSSKCQNNSNRHYFCHIKLSWKLQFSLFNPRNFKHLRSSQCCGWNAPNRSVEIFWKISFSIHSFEEWSFVEHS